MFHSAGVVPFRVMDPFVRRLVERLLDPRQPLSRNRHFHTFDNVHGRKALRISRRLRALSTELVGCAKAGGRARVIDRDDGLRVEVRLERLKATRAAMLDAGEYELLQRLPGVREALGL